MRKLSVELPFEGFYESTHNLNFDGWLEYEQEVLEQDYDATPEQVEKLADLFWNDVNWKAAYIAYAQSYVEALEQYMGDQGHYVANPDKESGREYVRFPSIKIEFEELKSPRFYNYETDRIYAKIALVDLEAMLAKIPQDAWAKKVKDNCTSYDGFISFLDNDAANWSSDLTEWGEAALGLLVQAYLEHIAEVDADGLREALSGFVLMENMRCNGEIDEIIFKAAGKGFLEFNNGELYALREKKEGV